MAGIKDGEILSLYVKMTSRKWIAFLLVGGTATALLLLRLITELTWKDVVLTALSVFVLGNVGQKWVETRANKILEEPKNDP